MIPRNDRTTPALIAAQQAHVFVIAELAKHKEPEYTKNDGSTPALSQRKMAMSLSSTNSRSTSEPEYTNE